MKAHFIKDHKGRITRWKCVCPGEWYRPLNLLQCQYCRATRPQPDGQEKPLDKAFKQLDELLNKDMK